MDALYLIDFSFSVRSSLSSTLTSLELAQQSFAYSQAELRDAKDSLNQTTLELIKSEKKIDRLDGNRYDDSHRLTSLSSLL